MRELLSKIFNGVKEHQDDIILIIGVILISLFSFAAGFIVARQQEKTPLRIEYNEQLKNGYCRSGDLRVIFGLETFSKRL